MPTRRMMTVDANEAAASVAHRLSEVIAIYPITPSSPMGEFSDEWSAKGQTNIWGTVPQVTEMQSEGGAAGAVHGALTAGALTTTFTASQGLLLMIPNMYKIAGELTPFTMHVTARTLATHALSIFGDHSDVMACRQTGFGMLASNSVQEAHDLALVAHAATLGSRVPFMHFFDGFRTSHEVAKIEEMTDADLRALIDDDLVAQVRSRALTPDRPRIRGTAQNPDTFFQSREACNPFYDACPDAVQRAMDRFAEVVGRRYRLFDYVGAPDAERVVVIMGSGAEVAHETVETLAAAGEKVGLVKVRLYRPFSVRHFVDALPASVRTVAVLDRTKETGAVGEPLYLDVVTALAEAGRGDLQVIGGRYGLSSKDFTPAQVKAVFDHAATDAPKRHFTVGIHDDVTHLSIPVDPSFSTADNDMVRALFWGLGADGTVGANKNSIKIIGEETDNYAQGYFVYDSKKSGGVTVSHLRFGPRPIRSAYLIQSASFVAVHQFSFVEKYDVLAQAAPGATLLLNSPYRADHVWDNLPCELQEQIVEKKIELYVIDAYKVARETGMGVRINTIMQTCFFAISGVLPRDEAIAKIKGAIEKTYSKKGDVVVQKNFQAVDATLANLHQVEMPDRADSVCRWAPAISSEAPEFARKVLGPMMALKGDELPVSALPVDGTFPTATTQWEKRNTAQEIPVWDPAVCIQCTKCSFVCPHATIRPKIYDAALLDGAPATFKSADAKGSDWKGKKYTIQIAPEDCTGCGLCVAVCPAKNKTEEGKKAINLAPQLPLREAEAANWAFFLGLPEVDRSLLKNDVKGSQLKRPLFEFSGCCAGCGETAYIKLVSQLYGDRALVANATGCSSIYGGNLPTTPYAMNADGRGPAWSNSLFEDNAEFGMGMRLAVDKQTEMARELLRKLAGSLGDDRVAALLEADPSGEAGIEAQRARVADLKDRLAGLDVPEAKRLAALADYLVEKSVWIFGGDGWAYDIGYGGLDHVLASGKNVNVLVMDTEVYSNTGGQMSKATPLGAAAKFAAAGKAKPKKDLGLIAMAYGDVYVAKVAYGSNDRQVVKAFAEAASYPGTSIIIAYAHCIAHGFDLSLGAEQQKKAVASGHWPLYRFDPRLSEHGKNPLQLDSKAPSIPLKDYIYNETRYKMLQRSDPERAGYLLGLAQAEVTRHFDLYEQLAAIKPGAKG